MYIILQFYDLKMRFNGNIPENINFFFSFQNHNIMNQYALDLFVVSCEYIIIFIAGAVSTKYFSDLGIQDERLVQQNEDLVDGKPPPHPHLLWRCDR